MKKLTKIILIVLVVAIVVAIAINGDKKQNGTIRIGSVEGLSGVVAFWGESSKKGMELAVEDLRKQGVDVEVIYEDSQGRVDSAAAVTQKLINIDKVDALFANFTGPSNAASPIALQNKKLIFYSAFDPALTQTNPYAFKTFMNAVAECKNIAEYSKNVLKMDKIAYVGVPFAFANSCIDEINKVYGSENVITEISQNVAETDFRSSLLKVKDFDADMIISFGFEVSYEAIMKQRVELGVPAPVFCAKADCYTEKIAKSVPLSTLEGSVMFDYVVPAEFTERIKSGYGDSVNSRSAALSYDALNYMVYAIQNCGSEDVECMKKDVANNTEYKSVITGSHFGGDQIYDLVNHYEIVKDGAFKEINIK